MFKKIIIFISLPLLLFAIPVQPQTVDTNQPLLSVRQIMTAILTPTTTTIWGAYELETDAEWLEIENAALSVIAAGNLLVSGGAGEGEQEVAREADWQNYNKQLIAAAREVIVAVENKDEEALFNAGNDALYPPCESCHQQYQTQ